MEPIRFNRAVWAVPVLLALLVTQNVLQNGFGWDDEALIQNTRAPSGLSDLFSFQLSSGPVQKSKTTYFRPVISFSYRLDRMIWGMRPFGFHLSVWLAHILNTVLVYFLARELVSGDSTDPGRNALRPNNWIPPVAASLFAVHPIHAEAVAWIAGRTDVFCTTFLLSSFLMYIRFRSGGGAAWFIGAAAGYALALLTKETAVGFIVLYPLYDFVSAGPMTKSGPSPLRRYGFSALILLLFGGYLWVRAGSIMYPVAGLTPGRIFSLPFIRDSVSAFGLYLKMLLVPYPHLAFVGALPVSATALILSALAVVLVGGGWVWAIARRKRLAAIGLGWMILTLIPAVLIGVLDLPAARAAERYVYAPSVGFLIVAAWMLISGTNRIVERFPHQRTAVLTAATATLCAMILLFGWTTLGRNPVWKNPLTYWVAAAAAAPEDPFALRQAGFEWARANRPDEAERYYKRAVSLYESRGQTDSYDTALVSNNLAALYRKEGRLDEAAPLFERALAIFRRDYGENNPDTATALHNLGGVYAALGRSDDAEKRYKEAVTAWERAGGPGHRNIALTAFALGGLYDRENRPAEAEIYYRKAVEIWKGHRGADDPFVASGLRSLAEVQRKQGDESGAEANYRRALSIMEKSPGSTGPEEAATLNNLAGLYQRQHRYEEAESAYRRAVSAWEESVGPGHVNVAASLNNYSVLLDAMDRGKEAEAMRRRAEAILASRPAGISP